MALFLGSNVLFPVNRKVVKSEPFRKLSRKERDTDLQFI